MAFKLTKDEKKARDEHDEKLKEAHAAVVEAVKAYNEKRAELWDAISSACDAFDEAREAAEEWARDVGSRIDDECSEKSDKWQDSDRGQEVQSWKGEYENFSLEALELEDPGDIDEPDAPQESYFEGLPEEVEA